MARRTGRAKANFLGDEPMNTVVSTRSIRALMLGLLVAAPAAAQLPSAKDLQAKHIQALGGPDAIKKHTQMHITGNFEVPAQGISGTMEIWSLAPDKMLSVQEIPGVGTIKAGYDGATAWQMNPMTGASVLSGKQLDQIKQQADLHSVLTPEKYIESQETVEKTTFDGKEAYKVKVVTKAGETYYEYYDASTGLNIGMQRSIESQMGPIEATTMVGDYKSVDGQLFPTKMRQSAMGMESVIVFSKIEFAGVDPALFELPKEIKALTVK
jgi:hypothetical protein